MNIEKVWKDYQALLKAYLNKNLSDPHDVEDVLQEILIKTHQQLPKLSQEDRLKSWLFQIAKHTLIDFYRSRGRYDALKVQSRGADEETPLSQGLDELADCVKPFIDALSPQDAELLTAIEIRGISQKSYAQEHDIKYSTLKSRVKKSRGKLFSLFNECCEFSRDAQGRVTDYQQRSGRCDRC